MAINKVVYGDSTLVDLTGDTVTAEHLEQGYTAHDKAGNPVTGTLTQPSGPHRTSDDLTVSGATVTAPAGIYDASASKSVATGSITPSASVSGSVIGDTESSYPVTVTPSASVSPGYIANGGNGTVVTKYVQVERKSVAPRETLQIIKPSTGKLLYEVIVSSIELADITAEENGRYTAPSSFNGLRSVTVAIPEYTGW